MEMEYTVELTILTAHPLTEDTLGDVAELGGVAGGNVGEHRLTTILTVPADSVATAMLAGAKRVTKLAPGQVIHASAATTDEFDRMQDEARARRELVGMSEVAELLGLSRQRVNEMVRDRNDVPAAEARLKSGPVWRKADWSTFASGWQRKAGRPRKVAPTESVEGSRNGEVLAPARMKGQRSAPARRSAS
jgi:predicted DNA-binding transcriptional regulator AlpA